MPIKSNPDIRRLITSIVSAGNELLREAGRLFKPHGISAAQFNVLHLLADAAEGMRLSELTAALVVDASSTTYLIDRMEDLGWVKRWDDASDRRAWRVEMTTAGRALHATLAPLYEAALREALKGLDPERIAPIADALADIQQAAHAAVDTVLAKNPPPAKKTGGKRSA